jgi:hypothetical protein
LLGLGAGVSGRKVNVIFIKCTLALQHDGDKEHEDFLESQRKRYHHLDEVNDNINAPFLVEK